MKIIHNGLTFFCQQLFRVEKQEKSSLCIYEHFKDILSHTTLSKMLTYSRVEATLALLGILTIFEKFFVCLLAGNISFPEIQTTYP